jgi:hypothetical protein
VPGPGRRRRGLGGRRPNQHELVVLYRKVREHGAGRRNARAFGVSQTVWTRCLAGERFMGETVMAAFLHAVYGW